MSYKNNLHVGFLIAGIIIFFVFSVHWIEFLAQSDNIWWTHADMMESFDESHERVEIIIQDRMLQDALIAGDLLLETESGTVVLGQDDFGFRFNNWDRVRALQIPKVILSSAATTLAVIMIIFGLIPMFAKRKDEQDDIKDPA